MLKHLRSQLKSWLTQQLLEHLSSQGTDLANPFDLHYCYRLLLGRKPDPEGWRDWLELIHAGIEREQLVNGFLSASEFHGRHQAQLALIETERFLMYVDPQDPSVGLPIVQSQSYEPHVTKALLQVIKTDSVFVDVGANMGWFTLSAASVIKSGKVIAIEPNDRNVQILCRSLRKNNFQHIFVAPFAIAYQTELLELNYTDSNGYVSDATMEKDTAQYVQGVRLDDLLQNESRVDLIKIDIEGYEPIALPGMQATIKKHSPVIISEFHPQAIKETAGTDPAEYLQALIDLGYTLAVIHASGEQLPMGDRGQILNHWRSLNQQLGTGERMHLDLLATPIR